MTAPANKRRNHNDAARDAKRRIPVGKPGAAKTTRRSPMGRRLDALRRRRQSK